MCPKVLVVSGLAQSSLQGCDCPACRGRPMGLESKQGGGQASGKPLGHRQTLGNRGQRPAPLPAPGRQDMMRHGPRLLLRSIVTSYFMVPSHVSSSHDSINSLLILSHY